MKCPCIASAGVCPHIDFGMRAERIEIVANARQIVNAVISYHLAPHGILMRNLQYGVLFIRKKMIFLILSAAERVIISTAYSVRNFPISYTIHSICIFNPVIVVIALGRNCFQIVAMKIIPYISLVTC